MEKQQAKKRKVKIIWKGFILRLFFLFLFVAAAYGGFIFYKFYRMQQKVIIFASDQENSPQKGIVETAKNLFGSQKAILRGQSEGRINILLLGMGGEGHKGENLTDTIMLVSIDPVSFKSAMLSIPRDLYTQIADTEAYTKINAIYAYALKNNNNQGESFSTIKETVKNITGQDVHYYVALDFQGFKKIIEEVGGIDVEVEHDIYDPLYPGPNYSYDPFKIKKGFHHLDAETALKYARVRHTKGGDFGRAARQQQVLAATKRKSLSLGTIINPHKISNLIDVLGDHLKTDIQLAEIPSFIHLGNNINIYQTTTKVLDAWSEGALLASTHVTLGGVQAYVLMPRAKNYSQIHELAENILELQRMEKKAKAISAENAKIEIVVDKNTSSQKIINIMKKFGYNISIKHHNSSEKICQMTNSIVSHSSQPKVFTLDDLAEKLEMQVVYSRELSDERDITLCLTKELIDYFESQLEQEKEYYDQNIVDENGNVLINKK